VGAVVWPYYMKARKKPVRDYLLDTIALSPTLADRLKDAELVEEPTATATTRTSAIPARGRTTS
jgi:hypothetical protein